MRDIARQVQRRDSELKRVGVELSKTQTENALLLASLREKDALVERLTTVLRNARSRTEQHASTHAALAPIELALVQLKPAAPAEPVGARATAAATRAARPRTAPPRRAPELGLLAPIVRVQPNIVRRFEQLEQSAAPARTRAGAGVAAAAATAAAVEPAGAATTAASAPAGRQPEIDTTPAGKSERTGYTPHGEREPSQGAILFSRSAVKELLRHRRHSRRSTKPKT